MMPNNGGQQRMQQFQQPHPSGQNVRVSTMSVGHQQFFQTQQMPTALQIQPPPQQQQHQYSHLQQRLTTGGPQGTIIMASSLPNQMVQQPHFVTSAGAPTGSGAPTRTMFIQGTQGTHLLSPQPQIRPGQFTQPTVMHMVAPTMAQQPPPQQQQQQQHHHHHQQQQPPPPTQHPQQQTQQQQMVSIPQGCIVSHSPSGQIVAQQPLPVGQHPPAVGQQQQSTTQQQQIIYGNVPSNVRQHIIQQPQHGAPMAVIPTNVTVSSGPPQSTATATLGGRPVFLVGNNSGPTTGPAPGANNSGFYQQQPHQQQRLLVTSMAQPRAPMPTVPVPSSTAGVVPVVSSAPVPPSTQAQAQVVDEDKLYRDKVQQLAKYIEPLRRMIARLGPDDSDKLAKMKKLMDVLSNPNQRMALDTLNKCEKVLIRLNLDAQQMPASPSCVPSGAGPAVAANPSTSLQPGMPVPSPALASEPSKVADTVRVHQVQQRGPNHPAMTESVAQVQASINSSAPVSAPTMNTASDGPPIATTASVASTAGTQTISATSGPPGGVPERPPRRIIRSDFAYNSGPRAKSALSQVLRYHAAKALDLKMNENADTKSDRIDVETRPDRGVENLKSINDTLKLVTRHFVLNDVAGQQSGQETAAEPLTSTDCPSSALCRELDHIRSVLGCHVALVEPSQRLSATSDVSPAKFFYVKCRLASDDPTLPVLVIQISVRYPFDVSGSDPVVIRPDLDEIWKEMCSVGSETTAVSGQTKFSLVELEFARRMRLMYDEKKAHSVCDFVTAYIASSIAVRTAKSASPKKQFELIDFNAVGALLAAV